MKPSQPCQKNPLSHAIHGLKTLKRAVKTLGSRVIDRRTTLGKALSKWRSNLIADLGGQDSLSTQQAALVDLTVKTKLILDSIDAWILTQPSLINHRKRSLLPVVRERTALADSLARYLKDLGLERKTKEIDLRTLMQKATDAAQSNWQEATNKA